MRKVESMKSGNPNSLLLTKRRLRPLISCIISITLSILTCACGDEAGNSAAVGGSSAGGGVNAGGFDGLSASGSGGSSYAAAGGGANSTSANGGKAATNASGGKGNVAGTAGSSSSKGGSGGATGCGNGGGKFRGKSTQTLTAADTERAFVLYESAKLDAKKPAPLVIVPHGFTMTGEAMYTITGYDKIADREGLVVAYPDGQLLTPWYVGTEICGLGGFVGAGTDIDQDFVNEIIKFVDDDQCVDRDHIYITGFSMGGYFSHETACVNPAFRAAGPHSGGTHDLSGCAAKKKPVIIFHFKSDALISYDCAVDARDKWVDHNGCNPSGPDVTTVKGGTCEYYKGCPTGGQVALCSFDESETGVGELITGHAWSGGTADPFGIPQTESATELGWAFFKKYAW